MKKVLMSLCLVCVFVFGNLYVDAAYKLFHKQVAEKVYTKLENKYKNKSEVEKLVIYGVLNKKLDELYLSSRDEDIKKVIVILKARLSGEKLNIKYSNDEVIGSAYYSPKPSDTTSPPTNTTMPVTPPKQQLPPKDDSPEIHPSLPKKSTIPSHIMHGGRCPKDMKTGEDYYFAYFTENSTCSSNSKFRCINNRIEKIGGSRIKKGHYLYSSSAHCHSAWFEFNGFKGTFNPIYSPDVLIAPEKELERVASLIHPCELDVQIATGVNTIRFVSRGLDTYSCNTRGEWDCTHLYDFKLVGGHVIGGVGTWDKKYIRNQKAALIESNYKCGSGCEQPRKPYDVYLKAQRTCKNAKKIHFDRNGRATIYDIDNFGNQKAPQPPKIIPKGYGSCSKEGDVIMKYFHYGDSCRGINLVCENGKYIRPPVSFGPRASLVGKVLYDTRSQCAEKHNICEGNISISKSGDVVTVTSKSGQIWGCSFLKDDGTCSNNLFRQVLSGPENQFGKWSVSGGKGTYICRGQCSELYGKKGFYMFFKGKQNCINNYEKKIFFKQ